MAPLPNLARVKEAIDELSAERARLDEAIEAAKREREELSTAPLCKADVLSLMHAQLDKEAAAAPERLAQAIMLIASRPLKTDWKNVPILSNGPGPADVGGNLAALVGLLAPEIKKALTAAMKAVPEIEGSGPPIAHRLGRIEALDMQISRDEAALIQLRQEASSAGISLKRSVF
jgi:hypothetical protein